MKNIRVNILSAVNADSIKIERKGDLAIIKNYRWHIDDVVLNGGLYPADENDKGYMSMNGRLAPAGHPRSGDKYVAISNLDNEDATKALADHYIGARTVNVRKSGSNYFADIEVNTSIANASADGKAVNKWIDDAESYLAGNGKKPGNIHTSTGLNTIRINESGESRGKKYTWRATNQSYDHLAILPNGIGAGGDELSLSLNAAGEECEVINCDITDYLDQSNDISEDLFSKVWNKLLNAVKSTPDGQLSPEVNSNIEVDPMKEMLINALKAKGVETDGLDDAALLFKYNESMKEDVKKDDEDDKKKKDDKAMNAESIQAIVETAVNAAVKPLQAQLAANADEKKADAIKDILAHNKAYTEDELKAIPESMLNKLHAESKPAAGLSGGRMQANSDGSVFGSDYSFGDQ